MKDSIPVAWTFMSEILTKHVRDIQRLPSYNNLRFDRASWPCDGHECPSCIDGSAAAFRLSIPGSTHLPNEFRNGRVRSIGMF